MSIKINSDYVDFYDDINDDKSIYIYNRFKSKMKQRGTALKHLRTLGIKTIELKPVSSFCKWDGNIVVYTDVFAHDGMGKKVMAVEEAQAFNNNCLASKYYESPISIKVLQIGNVRVTLKYEKETELALDKGKLVDIDMNKTDYNRLIGIPIYSIDYISGNEVMLATDFNEVENLMNLGLDEYITKEQIVELIKGSLLAYNLI